MCWLPRRRTSDIAQPGNEFWLLGGELAQCHRFAGTGDWAKGGKDRATGSGRARAVRRRVRGCAAAGGRCAAHIV
ncbi:DUF6879 family protein [Streptomyces goshikiensis]|uniref:DUF6879 family protein n=1 Tax=Streptomyces goshikiensis TaxID=1942 RepID=UPI0036AF3944